MEKDNRNNGIVLLLDNFSQKAQDLYYSFLKTQMHFFTVVIDGEGFLPDNIINPYEYYLGDVNKENAGHFKPCYFNQVQIPDYWEISGNNTQGEISSHGQLKGRIFYASPLHKRQVRVVDWYDSNNVARCCEHYNKYGRMYARTILNEQGLRVSKSYFDINNVECIVENFVTGDIILNYGGRTYFFKNKTEFICHFFKELGYDDCPIYFNSLSYPFFVSNRLHNIYGKNDILFWQEEVSDEIPGNMKMIFEGDATRCKKMVVQSAKAYDRLCALGADVNMLIKRGFVYPFEKENGGANRALICTNTENVEKLSELLEALPQMTFFVVALTEMSAKLMSNEKYKNARLYPNIPMNELKRLFMSCDYYLDINHEGEIVDALRKAFIHNHIILAFNETIHNRDIVVEENKFDSSNFMALADYLKNLMQDSSLRKEILNKQRFLALSEETEAYKEFFS